MFGLIGWWEFILLLRYVGKKVFKVVFFIILIVLVLILVFGFDFGGYSGRVIWLFSLRNIWDYFFVKKFRLFVSI